MALVRRSNTKRNIIMISALAVAIIAAGVWYFVTNKPLDITNEEGTLLNGRRDIDKLRQFNNVDFVTEGVFNRADYQQLESHGAPLPEQIESGVVNPFVASQ